ncbi:MAG: AgmX/PglI C-terminal domain-containing protein [Bradymonadaceae bacterium]
MKIVCGSCGAKYSIADEKVQGKVFKIRCKKCSDVIVVKGTVDADANQAESDYSAAYGQSGSASEWYVVINGEQQGPMTPDEVSAYCTAGQLTPESFCWREGLDDWVMLSTVDEFSHFVQETAGPDEQTMIAHQPESPAGYQDSYQEADSASGYQEADDATAVITAGQYGLSTGAEQPQAGYEEQAGYDQPQAGYEDQGGYDQPQAGYDQPQAGYEQQSGYEQQPAYEPGGYDDLGGGGYGADAYGAAAPAAEAQQDAGYGLAGQPGAYDDGGYGGGYDDDGGGMFAAFDAAGTSDAEIGGGYGSFGGEDSSSHDNGAAVAAGGFQAGNDMVGARNENSVLFSLSSLDQVQAVSKPMGSNEMVGAAQGNDKSGLIDIQKLASAHSSMKSGGAGDGADAFASSSMSMPALMPMGSHRNNKPLIIGVVVGAFLLVAGMGIALILVLNKEPQTQIIETTTAVPEQPVVAANSAEDEREAAEAAAVAEAAREAAAQDDDGEEAPEEEKEVAKADTKAPRKSSSSPTPRRQEAAPTPKSDPTPAPTVKKTAPRGDGGIDDIIGGLGTSGGKTAPAEKKPAPAASNLPASLSRQMVQSTVQRHNAQIAQCSSGSNSGNLSGTATVRFTVQPNGSVSAANVQAGEFRGTDVGGCIERVVRGMSFPATSGDARTINYPFILR